MCGRARACVCVCTLRAYIHTTQIKVLHNNSYLLQLWLSILKLSSVSAHNQWQVHSSSNCWLITPETLIRVTIWHMNCLTDWDIGWHLAGTARPSADVDTTQWALRGLQRTKKHDWRKFPRNQQVLTSKKEEEVIVRSNYYSSARTKLSWYGFGC